MSDNNLTYLMNKQYMMFYEKMEHLLKMNEPCAIFQIQRMMNVYGIKSTLLSFNNLNNCIWLQGGHDAWLININLMHPFLYGNEVRETCDFSEKDSLVWRDSPIYDSYVYNKVDMKFRFLFERDLYSSEMPQEMEKLFQLLNQHIIDVYGREI